MRRQERTHRELALYLLIHAHVSQKRSFILIGLLRWLWYMAHHA